MQLSDHRTFVVADLPGIIEGAHEGRGLGLNFLRHIERTRLLAMLIPIDSLDWQAEYDGLRREIAAYSPELLAKPHCVVFTKTDLLGADSIPPPEIVAPDAFSVIAISAAARQGLDRMLETWWSELLALKRRAESSAEPAALPLP